MGLLLAQGHLPPLSQQRRFQKCLLIECFGHLMDPLDRPEATSCAPAADNLALNLLAERLHLSQVIQFEFCAEVKLCGNVRLHVTYFR